MKKSELREIVREVIRKVGDEYAVYPKRGGKRLGTHSTRAAAEKQLAAIHINKEEVEINYTQPNFEFEWEEANRYPEFQEMGKQGWVKVAKKGKATPYSSIKKILGNVDLNFKGLEQSKKERFQAAFKKGVIEMPIAVKFNEKDYDLVAGNTRLSGLVNNGVDPKIWVVDISDVSENKHEPMNPGILKKRLGKLSCSKVRAERSKLKDKGTTYAKALQRYLNYHCQ